MAGSATTEQELDVRPLRKPDKQPAVFAAYADLPVGGSSVLINDHDPIHLREEFESDYSGGCSWEHLARGIRNGGSDHQAHLHAAAADPGQHHRPGRRDRRACSQWCGVEAEIRDRDLDSNIIAIPPGRAIDAHAGLISMC